MQPKGQNIADRLLAFSGAVVRIGQGLVRNPASRAHALQMMDAATSAGANYEEARGAESRADFIHKLGVAIKELREATFWLRLAGTVPLSNADITALVAEAHELTAILVASRKTAMANTRKS